MENSKMKNSKRLILLSLDAVGTKDLEYMMTLPNFREFYSQAAVCPQVASVYPSLTYPAHATIVTGRYPRSHGIVNNFLFQPKRKRPDWFWYRKQLMGTTLYDQAAKMGMEVAALLWPVTGRAKIQYNMPEIFPNRLWQNQILMSIWNGSPLYQLELEKKLGHMRKGFRQPQLDDFAHAALLYTLKKYQPQMVLAHWTDVDANRHLYGVESPQAREALKRHDRRLGELTALLKEMGVYEETNLVILGDHYQRDVHHVLHPNYHLAKKGYLKVEHGKIKEWKALAWSCDGSCYLYAKDPASQLLTWAFFDNLMKQGGSGIGRIYSVGEATELGADPACSIMMDAAPGYCFQNGWEEWATAVRPQDGHVAAHGYLPSLEGYQTLWMAAGPDFCPGVVGGRVFLVDVAPTLAHVLGLDLGEVDGLVKHRMLRQGNGDIVSPSAPPS